MTGSMARSPVRRRRSTRSWAAVSLSSRRSVRLRRSSACSAPSSASTSALIKIGAAGQASIDAVAGPVGEALIMTALGLVVAVPAVLAYNWLQRRNKGIAEDLSAFSNDVLGYLASGGAVKPVVGAPAKPAPVAARPTPARRLPARSAVSRSVRNLRPNGVAVVAAPHRRSCRPAAKHRMTSPCR